MMINKTDVCQSLISERLRDNYSEQKNENCKGKKVSIVLITVLHLTMGSV